MLQFIIAQPTTSVLSKASQPVAPSVKSDDDSGASFSTEKDKIATIHTADAAAKAGRMTVTDPLDPSSMDPSLVVFRFALTAADQQQQLNMHSITNSAAVAHPEFTITLNKYNTVKDHVSFTAV